VIANLFATRVGRGIIWKQKLEGWNVEESTYVNEWIAVGEKRGEARGEARGKEVGSMEEAQVVILRLGAKRFGSVPDEVAATVRAIRDRARLERILDRILDAPSWDDLVVTA
jgi:predicted transposase YdaD